MQDAGDDTSSTSIVQHNQRFAGVVVRIFDETALVQKGVRKLAGDVFTGLVVLDELVVLEHGLPVLLASHGGIRLGITRRRSERLEKIILVKT